jgi:hypothetical protein
LTMRPTRSSGTASPMFSASRSGRARQAPSLEAHRGKAASARGGPWGKGGPLPRRQGGRSRKSRSPPVPELVRLENRLRGRKTRRGAGLRPLQRERLSPPSPRCDCGKGSEGESLGNSPRPPHLCGGDCKVVDARVTACTRGHRKEGARLAAP